MFDVELIKPQYVSNLCWQNSMIGTSSAQMAKQLNAIYQQLSWRSLIAAPTLGLQLELLSNFGTTHFLNKSYLAHSMRVARRAHREKSNDKRHDKPKWSDEKRGILSLKKKHTNRNSTNICSGIKYTKYVPCPPRAHTFVPVVLFRLSVWSWFLWVALNLPPPRRVARAPNAGVRVLYLTTEKRLPEFLILK